MRRLLEGVEARVLVAILVILFLGSIAIATAEQFLRVEIKASWSTPLVLASLYFIVRLVSIIPDIGTDVKSIGTDVKSLIGVAESIRVQRISNVDDFYKSLGNAVDKATSTLDLTHIRSTPPSDFGATATDFYDRLIKWCTGGDGRTIRRVISVRNPEMRVWAQQLAADTEHLPQFCVRVVDWATDAPAINFAIVDERAAYIALTGSMIGRQKGLAIDDLTVSQNFKDYYENLWNNSTDVNEWLAAHTDEG